MRTGPRYRRLETSFWADEDVRSLSDDAKLLCLFIRTGPHTTSVPGLWSAGQLALAEKLGWSSRIFRKAFDALHDRGLVEADWQAGVIFVPRVLDVDPPASPDAIRGWRDTWSEIPACVLKTRVCADFRTYCEGRGPSFLSAFLDVVGGDGSIRISQRQNSKYDKELR